MKLLLVGYMFGLGGIQTHTHYLASGLVELGHDVEVLTPAKMPNHPGEAPSETPYRLFVYSSLVNLIKKCRGAQPDAIVVCGTGFKPMLSALCTRGACKRIFFEVMSGHRVGKLDPRILVRFGFHAVVGQGSGVENRFVSEFGWKGPRTTIPALPEPLERTCNIVKLPTLAARDGDGFRFAYFGRLARHKNVGFLVENFDDFAPPGSTLHIYGGGEDLDNLTQLIEARRLSNRIILCGPYPNGQAYVDLLQSFDIMLLPTIGSEGAPLVLLEAMACGVPFVANGVGGIPDYSNDDCRITSGKIEEFVPLVRDLCQKWINGEIDRSRLQDHYLKNFAFHPLVRRWEHFLGDMASADD